MIINISIEKLHSHPQNPRKDLGDLTELANSIKENGVFQNLTVVPRDDDTYTIIIGHRRKAAAEKAGLKELPCAIVEMSEKEQLSTMLLENMQRSDLTPYEQAQGFQLMLDLGESVEGISKQTGFSKSTIYHRVHLLELDQEEFRNSQERDISMSDYIKLEQLKSIYRKNEALKFIGTNDFNFKFQNLLNEEKREENVKEVIAYLNTVATDVTENQDETQKYQYETWCEIDDIEDAKDCIENIREDAPDIEIFYKKEYSFINFYTLKQEDEKPEDEEPEESEQARKAEEIRSKFKQMQSTMLNLRCDFVKNYTGKKEHFDYLLKELMGSLVLQVVDYKESSRYSLSQKIAKLLNLKTNREKYNERLTLEDFNNLVDNDKSKLLLLCLYFANESEYNFYFDSYYLAYKKCETLDKLYEILTNVGYKISEEEKQIMDGTHPLYQEAKELNNETT